MPRQRGMHEGALHPLLEQVAIHGRTNDILPDGIQRVSAKNTELLRLEIGLRTSGLHPDISAGARNHARLGREPI